MSIVDDYKSLISYRRRQSLKEVEKHARVVSGAEYLDHCRFITGENDWNQVHDLQFLRDGTQIVKKKSEGDGVNISTYAGDLAYLPPMLAGAVASNVVARPGEAEKYGAWMLPTVVSGVAQSILKTIACLFKDSQFQFMSGDQSADEAQALIDLHRVSGGFHNALSSADYVSSGMQSSIVHVFGKGDWLDYCSIWPSAITIVFGDKITEVSGISKRENSREADTTDLEDASAVIICMGSAGNTANPAERVWLAYVGGCDGEELGRKVSYRAESAWPIPEVGDDKIVVETTAETGMRCNPMTYTNRTYEREGIGGGYDYPLTIIKGDAPFCDGSLLPLSDTFARNCKDIEYLWSGIAENIRRCARGKDVFTMSATVTDLPSSLDVIVCPNGLTHQYIQGNASGIAGAVDALTTLTRGVASSRGVPPYIVVGPVPWAAESGVSLAIQTAPLIDAREARIKTNMRAVTKLFHVESALLASMNPNTKSVLQGVQCVWTPGEYKIPRERAAFLADLKTERDLEVIDQVELVQKARGLGTVQQAIETITQMEERDPEYTGLNPERTRAAKEKADADQFGTTE